MKIAIVSTPFVSVPPKSMAEQSFFSITSQKSSSIEVIP